MCLSRLISQEPYIIWLSFIVHMWKNYNISSCFFHFFKILIFWVVRGVKRKKMTQNEKKILSVTCSISQEPYITWLSFMVHLYKMIISPGVLNFFKILIFWVVRGVKGQKLSKMKKNSACLTLYLRNHTSYDCNFWQIFVTFFHFSKFWFLQFLWG